MFAWFVFFWRWGGSFVQFLLFCFCNYLFWRFCLLFFFFLFTSCSFVHQMQVPAQLIYPLQFSLPRTGLMSPRRGCLVSSLLNFMQHLPTERLFDSTGFFQNLKRILTLWLFKMPLLSFFLFFFFSLFVSFSLFSTFFIFFLFFLLCRILSRLLFIFRIFPSYFFFLFNFYLDFLFFSFLYHIFLYSFTILFISFFIVPFILAFLCCPFLSFFKKEFLIFLYLRAYMLHY